MKTSRWSWQKQHVHHKWKSHLILHNGRKLTWFYLVSMQLCAIGTSPEYLLRGNFFFLNSQLVSVFSYLLQPSCLIFTEALCWFFCLSTVKRYKGAQQFMHLQLRSHNKVLKIKKLAQGNCLIWERLYRQWTSVSQLQLMALSSVSCARSSLPKKILRKKKFPAQHMLI